MREHVDATLGGGELPADVGGPVDVDDSVPAALGAEHGEMPAVVELQLGVDPAAAAPECADELAGEALPLERADARDDREPGVQRDAERVRSGLDDQPLVAHVPSSAGPGPDLSAGLASGPGAAAILDGLAAAPAAQPIRPLSSVGRAQPW